MGDFVKETLMGIKSSLQDEIKSLREQKDNLTMRSMKVDYEIKKQSEKLAQVEKELENR